MPFLCPFFYCLDGGLTPTVNLDHTNEQTGLMAVVNIASHTELNIYCELIMKATDAKHPGLKFMSMRFLLNIHETSVGIGRLGFCIIIPFVED